MSVFEFVCICMYLCMYECMHDNACFYIDNSSNAARRYDDGCHVSRPRCFGMLFRG